MGGPASRGGKKKRGEKPTCLLTPPLHAIGKSHTSQTYQRMRSFQVLSPPGTFCRELEVKLWPVLAQPVPMAAIVGAFLGDQRPETRGMIALFEMRQLVDDDVVQHGERRQ